MDNEELENDVNEAAEGLDNQNEEVTKEVGKFESVLETKGKQAVATASKKVIAKLLKKKIIIISLVGAVILLFFIIMAALLNSSGVNDYIYKSTSCKNVTIHYDPYGEGDSYDEEMDLEDYVKGAVVAYLNNFTGSDSSNYQLYFALSVALRNEVITNNCEVTYRDKTIDSNVTIDDYYLNLAITNSYGIALVDENEEFVPMHVADNCWYNSGIMQNSEGEDVEFHTAWQKDLEIPREFTKKYFKNTVYEECQCNADTGVKKIGINAVENMCYTYWIEEEEINGVKTKVKYEEYLHQDEEDGFNLYGAYYLLRYRGLTNLDILKYFTNDKVMYRTTSKESAKKEDTGNNFNYSCSAFNIGSTTLSRDEFISKVENYNSKKSDWGTFKSHAGELYDLAVSNGVNPEFIVVRAIVEGMSPGGSSYNYYGIGCTNTGGINACIKYSSFSDGVLGIISFIKKYDSVDSLMSKYAFIGTYWYNPGSSSKGGCYYYPYIKEYMSPERASVVASACNGATCSGADCTKTNDEDQMAYTKYQVSKMTDYRSSVFGIKENNCTNDTMTVDNCIIYAQSDKRWGQFLLGNSKDTTISKAGCAVSSVAIALTCTGKMSDTSSFSPKVLNDTLKLNGGFDGAAIVWNNKGIREFVPSFRVDKDISLSGASMEEKLNALNASHEKSNRIGIVHISNSEHKTHFVVLNTYNPSNKTFTSLDPAGGKINTYSINDLDRIIYYTY